MSLDFNKTINRIGSKKKSISVLVILAFVIIGIYLLVSSKADTVPHLADSTNDANWLLSLQITSGPMTGVFANQTGRNSIRPYNANLGTLGLSRATQLTGDKKYVNAVWTHLNWYANHMDSNGYVLDYDYNNSTQQWVSSPTLYDSTDSYAATFLLSIRTAYKVDPDKTKLQALKVPIAKAINAIHSTQQSDGLTWATPQWHVKYLMDNVEAEIGLQAGADLGWELGDPALATTAQTYANAVLVGYDGRGGMESLWHGAPNSTVSTAPISDQWYYWAKHEGGGLQSNNYTVLTDSMQQAWLVAFKTITGARANRIMDAISNYQPTFDDQYFANICDNDPDNDHYPNYAIPIGWAYYNIGQTARAQAAAQKYRDLSINYKDCGGNNRAWNFEVAVAGELIILETNGVDLVTAPLPRPANSGKAIEPEQGIISGITSVVTDPTASGNGYIRF